MKNLIIGLFCLLGTVNLNAAPVNSSWIIIDDIIDPFQWIIIDDIIDPAPRIIADDLISPTI